MFTGGLHLVCFEMVKESLRRYILEESGIYLGDEDMEITVEDDGTCLLTLFRLEASRAEILEEGDETDLAMALLENMGNCPCHLSRLKIEQLERDTGPTIQEIVDDVASKHPGAAFSWRFIDGGHFPPHHGMVEQEYVRDYPDIFLIFALDNDEDIDMDDSRQFEVQLDPYQDGAGLDLDEIKEKLVNLLSGAGSDPGN